MSWVTSPACTEVETLMLDWMRELLDLPERFHSTSATGGGVIQGSASEATLCAILAARWRATGGAVNADGDTSRLVAYATAQAHSSIEKGLRIAGIGTDRLRVVPHDETFAMRPDALAGLIAADRAAGLVPCFVCANHGTTSSMAFDPTPAIGADLPATSGVWLHVDAAMSGIAALAPEQRWVNAGLELADSYCTNPHKWMGVNFDCDLFWTADRAALLGALSILPEYLRSAAAEAGAVIDYRDWQVPLGRRFRALKLWFALRLDGVAPVQAMIARHVELTARLAELVAADERFEIVAPHPLNLLCVRLRAGDAATDALIERANATGRVLFTRTVLDGAERAAHLDRRLDDRVAPRRGGLAPPPVPGLTAPPSEYWPSSRRIPALGTRTRSVLDGRPALGSQARRRRRSTSIAAVAPHTVSSSSSKK